MHDIAALTRRWFDEVWTQNRAATIDELLDPAVVIHGLADDGRPTTGPEPFKRFHAALRSALSDIRATVDDVLVDGDRSAARVTVLATHAGDGFGVPPTGRRITVTGIVITRWRGGRIVEGWNQYDSAGMMRQVTAPAG
ncbi:MAG TPA: ester cyclase [Humisphaera sp.]